MNPVASERGVDRFGIPLRPAPNNRVVFLGYTLLLHHQTKTPRGRRVLRHENQSARFAVESIHDRNLPAIRDLEREQMLQFAPFGLVG